MSKSMLALVFLHYFGGSSQEWNGMTAAMGDEYSCLALNLRGHGGTGDSDGYARGIDALVDDVAAEIKEAGLTEYVVVGHSMGGKVALALAARQPGALRGLFLLAPSPPTPEPISDKDRAESLADWGDQQASEEALLKITHFPVTADTAERFTADNLRTTEAVWYWWYSIGSREDISDRMGRVEVPVLTLVGSEDKVIPLDVQQRETAVRLANARLEVVPEAGHLLTDEAPQAVDSALRKFLTVLPD